MTAALKQFAWTAYDHMGRFFLLNLLWSGLSLPWFGLGMLIFVLGAGMGEWGFLGGMLLALDLVLVAPPTVLFFLGGRRWARGEEVSIKEIFRQLPCFAWRAQALGLMVVGAHLVLLVNAFFYRDCAGWLGLVLSGVMLWFMLAVAMVSVFVFPVLLGQEGGIWQTARQSFLLVVDNVKLSLGLLLAVLVFLGLGMLSGIGLFCGLLAGLALLISVCFRRLLPKYTGELLPEEPSRRLRELIRPWDS